MMSLRSKFRANRARISRQWRCCFCCHVHTATIFFGMWNLLLQIMLLSVFAVLMRSPRLRFDVEPALPTPQSKIEMSQFGDTDFRSSFNNNGNMREVPRVMPSLPRDAERQDLAAAVNENLNKCVIVVAFTFGITLLMVYGAVKGKPSYLKPFFWLQVLDFCICSVKAVDYLCYLPDVHGSLLDNPDFPLHDFILRLDPQVLALFILLGFIIAMVVKAYFIGVVWSCYKYLKLRQVRAHCTIHYIDQMTSQSLLNDPPDYETAVKKFPAPPPSYEVATAMALNGAVTVEGAQALPGPAPLPGSSGIRMLRQTTDASAAAGAGAGGPSTSTAVPVTVSSATPPTSTSTSPTPKASPTQKPSPSVRPSSQQNLAPSNPPFPSAVPTALVAVTGPNAVVHSDPSPV